MLMELVKEQTANQLRFNRRRQPLDKEKDMVEHFNHYFASVFTRNNFSSSTGFNSSTTEMHDNSHDSDTTCSKLTLDISMVSKGISRLRPDKSMGPDGLSP